MLDYLAIGVHELASMSERRIERLVNPGNMLKEPFWEDLQFKWFRLTIERNNELTERQCVLVVKVATHGSGHYFFRKFAFKRLNPNER